jgi:excisionase family DNA binding protein
MPEHRILRVKDLTALLRVHRSTVYKYVRDPAVGLPGFKIGDDWRFDEDDILRWMKERAEG